MLLNLPHEIISLILLAIDTPRAFFNVLQTCKLVYSLSPIKQKRVEFLQKIERIETKEYVKEKHIYSVLPNGKEEGSYEIYSSYDESEFQLLANVTYVNGVQEGPYIEYEDGNITLQSYFENGKIFEIHREFDEFGRLITEGSRINGTQIGPDKTWDYFADGTCYYVETTHFTNRKVVKSFESFPGKNIAKGPMYEYTYIDFKRCGPYKIWDSDGRLTEMGEMENEIVMEMYRWKYTDAGIYFTHKIPGKSDMKFKLNDNFEFIKLKRGLS